MITKNRDNRQRLKPDFEEAQRFCDLIAGVPNALMTFQVFDDKGKHPEWAGHRHGRLSDPAIRKWLASKNKQGCGIYVTVGDTDGKGRRRENIRKARAIWADFDGTPLPAKWPIPPDIHTESSDGRYQVFWLIDPDADLNRASNLQARLAEFFGTDGSIIDPARVCRLPGFYHHKRKPFRSRIVRSKDPESLRLGSFARKDMAEIEKAHPCDFAAPAQRGDDGRSEEPTGGWDNAADIDRARVYLESAPPSIEGERGNDTAYRVACVLNDLGISPEKSLELMVEGWNERCEPPWSDEELERITANATRYKSGSAGSDSIASDFAGADPDKDDWLEGSDADGSDDDEESPKSKKVVITDWVWIVEAKLFVNQDGVRMYDKEQFTSVYGHLRPKSNIVLDIFRGKVTISKYQALVYIPKAARVVKFEGKECFNIWRPSGLKPAAGDHEWFLHHVAYLIPNERERELALDFMAQLIQHPEVKMHFAMLIQSVEGVGKGALGVIMRRAIGSRNCVEPSNDEVTSVYTGWQEGKQLAVVNELMAIGRLEIMNRLKSPIADPMLRVHKKFGNPYSIPNHLNFMCFSNHKDALPISAGDRRWFVIFSPAAPKGEDYYNALFANIASDDKVAAVMHFLMKRTIKLNPKGVAPMTEAKKEMRQLSLTDIQSFLSDRFEAREQPFECDLVRVEDIVDAIPLEIERRQKNVHALVLKFLDDIKAQKQKRYTHGEIDYAYQLWSIANHDDWKARSPAGRAHAYKEWRTILTDECSEHE